MVLRRAEPRALPFLRAHDALVRIVPRDMRPEARVVGRVDEDGAAHLVHGRQAISELIRIGVVVDASELERVTQLDGWLGGGGGYSGGGAS